MNPFFTVIITTYNRPHKLLRAIKSVLTQTYENFELVIVNDGSTQDYNEVENFIKNYPNRIKYYFKKNEERSIARNFGVDKASGDFICFLDDDDYYLENHLQVLYNEIEKRDFEKALYHTYSKKYNQDGRWTKYDIIPKDPSITEQEYYLTGGLMTMNCSCFAKNILIEFPYNPDLKMSEDSNQRLRALSKYPIFRIPEYTSVYDFSDSSTKNHSVNIILEFLKTWNISFNDPLIKNKVKTSIRNKTILKCYELIIFNHNKEIPKKELIEYISMAILHGGYKRFLDYLKILIYAK